MSGGGGFEGVKKAAMIGARFFFGQAAMAGAKLMLQGVWHGGGGVKGVGIVVGAELA